MREDGDLTLIAGTPDNMRALSGWQSIRVTRGIERLPSDFVITMTDRYPGETDAVSVKPGDACQVKIGGDLVITGYVDRFTPSIDGRAHSITVSGRGKCEDLVDCAAEWENNQISGNNALQIAQKLAKPYGITVTGIGDMGKPIPQFNILWGETCYSVIERIARYTALLAYDDTDGNLLLSRVGSDPHTSGIVEGKNVQRAFIEYSMDQRYSDYTVRLLNFDGFSELGGAADILQTFKDPAVTRHRLRYIIAEAGDGQGLDVSRRRGAWEAARRYGRSMQLHVTVDSWRDGDGVLWSPNYLLPISLPSLKLPNATWVIGNVTYVRDAGGTSAELTIMPPEAFDIEPIILQPTLRDVFGEQPGAPAR